MDHPPMRVHARTSSATRIFFCLSSSRSLPLSLSLCTDANETTAGLRDIYVRFSRTLLPPRQPRFRGRRPCRCSVLSFLSLSLTPAPRSLFALTRERRGPSPSRFFALSLSFSLPAVSAPVHMRARPRKHETRVRDGGALERTRLSPLMQNTHIYKHVHAHNLSLSLLCAYARTRTLFACTRARSSRSFSVSFQPAPCTAWRENTDLTYRCLGTYNT